MTGSRRKSRAARRDLPSCQGYLKQFYLEFDRHADALADDLASLALDMRLAEDGYLRRSPNLLLAPGGE